MDRRDFLQKLAAATATANAIAGATAQAGETGPNHAEPSSRQANARPVQPPEVQGHTLICEFRERGTAWKVYEDLRTREGAITFLAADGRGRVLGKNAEATFPQAETPYLGLKIEDIGMSGPDLLADKLLANGDPDAEQVRLAAEPVGYVPPPPPRAPGAPPAPPEYPRRTWNTFVGTKEAYDTQPVFPAGNTRTYGPWNHFPEITQEFSRKRYEGLIGGWMPAVRKVFPIEAAANADASAPAQSGYYEAVVFADTRTSDGGSEYKDKFILQTWHRTARVENGKTVSVFYGHSYPPYPPRRQDPAPEEFYRALLAFAEYWEQQLRDASAISLPESSWADMARYAFAKELMVRPGGVYPKYGAVDRDYAGSEYDGFQDIFTMALYANLEMGRFAMARVILDEYLGENTDSTGMINMRGPETGQYGLTLSLFARYFNYTGDAALLRKYREKIAATASLLEELHEESLKLPQDDAGYGLIHGWSESDSCLSGKPMTWWLPYYGNSAFAARGLRDLAAAWPRIFPGANSAKQAAEWRSRSAQLRETNIAAMRKNVRAGMNPPYIGPYAGAPGTFRDSYKQSFAKRQPNPQQWAHRAYAELLQADMLPEDLANLVVNCMRGHGATTLGVVANVEPPNPRGRAILGFISYGYAQMLLRLDRVEEFLLFLYSHRYHDHTPGSWTAGEVCGIRGGMPLFCIPAQQTIPLLVRWMLVLEDNDEERLYLGRGLPREWVASGKEIGIEQAATRWGRVNYRLQADPAAGRATAHVELARPGAPGELHVKFRLPAANPLKSATANGKSVTIGGPHNDTAIVPTSGAKRFEVIAEFASS